MIIFNYLAAGMVIPSLVIGYSIQGMTGNLLPENGMAVLTGMAIAFLMDWFYRLRQVEAGSWRLVSPGLGGQVMFLPVWCLALLIVGHVFYGLLIA